MCVRGQMVTFDSQPFVILAQSGVIKVKTV